MVDTTVTRAVKDVKTVEDTREKNMIWEIEPMSVPRHSHRRRDIHGTLVLDIDGTLTKPGTKYAIDKRAIDSVAKFLMAGGNIVFNTGATRYRVERTVLDPLYKRVEELDPKADVKDLFKGIYLQPENGSALLMNRRIYVQENMLEFNWTRIHQLHVPQKKELRAFLENEFVGKEDFRKCEVADDQHPAEGLRREYIVSLKGLKEGTPRDVIQEIERKKSDHPEIDWEKIEMKAARTTVDFVHKDSGKEISTGFLLKEVAGLDGPVIGVGDLGDEFASVVPTINVNQNKPNEFRIRGQPAMELKDGYELLEDESYVSAGEGKDEKIIDKKTAEEIMVLRGSKGQVIYGKMKDEKQGIISATDREQGHPMRIKDMKYWVDKETGKHVRGEEAEKLKGTGRLEQKKVDDAGGGSAWIIDYLVETGYFEKRNNNNNNKPGASRVA